MITGGLLVASLFFFNSTDIDLVVQRLLYDPQHRCWLIDANQPVLRFIFYSGVKGLLFAAGGGIIIAWLSGFWSNRLRPFRRVLFFLILSMGLVPLVVGGGKRVTNVFCPSELTIFNGNKPYVKLFDPMPPRVGERGCCFTAGHASGGFSLMSLYFLPENRHRRYQGLAVGFGLGWLMGLYQMAKGAHFLSHTVVTMEIAWFLILLFYGLLYRGWRTPVTEAVCERASGE